MARNAEARIQAAIVAYVRTVAPPPAALIFAIPNGGLRTKAEAGLLRWTGALAGVPDLCLVLPGGRCALWEVKTPEGRVSTAQFDVLATLDEMGVDYAIVRSIDDVREQLAYLGIHTRETEAA